MDYFTSYFTKIKRIWDELKMTHEIPNCSCGSTYEIMGLNDSYKAIGEQILMMNPLHNVSTVRSLLIHEEKECEISTNPNLVVEEMYINVHSSSKKLL